jgi:spermidine synthase
MTENIRKNEQNSLFLVYLLFTAFLCGALIMVVEVLGSRVIGPFYGVSLFVWTSLITVTLVALAAGYYIGGILCDRHPDPSWLYGIIMTSGIFVLLIPFLKASVLRMAEPLGLRMGSLVSAALLFGPCLLLLGCVSPFLVRLATRELASVGKTVGTFYATSTLGSFVGTVLTGFFLIAYFGINQIFWFIGSMLILLAVSFFVFFRKRWTALLVLFLLAIFPTEGELPAKTLPSGVTVKLLEDHDSFYGNIKVVEYSSALFRTREMMIDGMTQGGIDTASGMSIYAYPYVLQFLSRALKPDGKTCLVVGLGTGVMPAWFEREGVKADVLDIDPDVVKLARSHFRFHPAGRTIIGDARQYLNNPAETYDYMIMDVFNGDVTPPHLMSVEALRQMKKGLNENGLLGINLIGSLEKEPYMTASVIKTLATVFDNVELYPVYELGQDKGFGNIAVFAYDGSAKEPDLSSIKDFRVHPLARKEVMRAVETSYEGVDLDEAMILTDNYNPIDFYDSWIREAVRKGIQQDTDWQILIGS